MTVTHDHAICYNYTYGLLEVNGLIKTNNRPIDILISHC